MSEMNLKNWAIKFKNGDFNGSDVKVQIEAGWFDWFCNNKSLVNKTKTLGAKVIRLMKSDKINPEKSAVFFKNNRPLSGPLYDSFSICDIQTGAPQFWIVPKSCWSNQAVVYADPEWNHPAVSGTWKDVIEYFGV